MDEFLTALVDPALPFLRYALAAGILSAPTFAMVGTYVTTNRMTYVAGAIAHASLAGIGVALYVQAQHPGHWLTPLAGAFVAALLAAVVVGLVTLYGTERRDTIIGTVWAVGMAVGVLFIARAPGYVDPMSYLFGNILVLSQRDLLMVAGLDVVVLVLGTIFHTRLTAMSFDEEFSRIRGLRTGVLYLLLVAMVAVAVVMLTTIVGLILVIAFLTIPTAIAANLSRRIVPIMAWSAALIAAFTFAGMAISYTSDLPSGSVIIVIAGAAYLLMAGVRALLRRLSR